MEPNKKRNGFLFIEKVLQQEVGSMSRLFCVKNNIEGLEDEKIGILRKKEGRKWDDTGKDWHFCWD